MYIVFQSNLQAKLTSKWKWFVGVSIKTIKGHVCLQFLRTIFCSQKQGKQEKHVWFLVCFFPEEHKTQKKN